MVKVALVLAGCGYLDGSEIHESTLCLLALHQAGHEAHCFAPDMPQAGVINHITKQPMDESRNCLIESARIARGDIQPLKDLDPDAFDAILIPGGFGVASNLSTFAKDQADCSVNDHLRKAILGFYEQGKPIGATCIAPAVLGKVFEGVAPVTLTLGLDDGANAHLVAMGMEVEPAGVAEVVADEENKVFTTPCYMEPPSLSGMYEGIKQVVARLG